MPSNQPNNGTNGGQQTTIDPFLAGYSAAKRDNGGTNSPTKTTPGSAGKKRERTPGEKFAIATLEAIAELRGLPEETL